MAYIGHFCKYTIQIYSDERPIPHFHFIDFANEKEGCICLQENKYFNHGTKQNILNSKERKMLIDFLNTKVGNVSIFKNMCRKWNESNPNHKIVDLNYIPDYTFIKKWNER